MVDIPFINSRNYVSDAVFVADVRTFNGIKYYYVASYNMTSKC